MKTKLIEVLRKTAQRAVHSLRAEPTPVLHIVGVNGGKAVVKNL
jgi:hypothetical protein